MAASTEWDRIVNIHDILVPQWDTLTKGSSVSVVVDCVVHSAEMVLGTTVPDERKMRLGMCLGRSEVVGG